jgi:hypothetical protein
MMTADVGAESLFFDGVSQLVSKGAILFIRLRAFFRV